MSLNMKTPNSLFSRVLPFSPMIYRLPPNQSTGFPISRAHSSLFSSYKPAPFPCSTISPNPNHPLFFPSRYRRIFAAETTRDENGGVFEGSHEHKRLLVLRVILMGLFSCVALVIRRYETIPLSKRRHWVVMRGGWEKKLGKINFNALKIQDAILLDTHPATIRFCAIFKKLIAGLEKLIERDHDEAISIKVVEIMYNVFRIGKKKKKKGGAHLEWEIVVVDQPNGTAYCLIDGRIVVFRELLDHFKTDAEIATIIAHEVGHAIARHHAETLADYMGLNIIRIIVVVKCFLSLMFVDGIYKGNTRLVKDLWNSSSALEHYLSRKQEPEADYIGLLLLASAGYNPMIAPDVCKKLKDINGGSALDEYLSTYPSWKARVANLSQAKVMEEALRMYRDVKQELGVEK